MVLRVTLDIGILILKISTERRHATIKFCQKYDGSLLPPCKRVLNEKIKRTRTISLETYGLQVTNQNLLDHHLGDVHQLMKFTFLQLCKKVDFIS